MKNLKIKYSILKLLVLSSLSSCVLLNNAIAQETNKYSERIDIINKYKSTVGFGWYTNNGSSFELRELLNKFLPLSNYLSNKLQETVVFINDRSDKAIINDALEGQTDIVYTTAIFGSQLLDKKWKPLLVRSEDIIPVILMKKTVSIDSIKSWNSKKLLSSKGTTVNYFIKYALQKNNLLDKLNFVEKNVAEKDLISIFQNGEADGIVLSEKVANKLIESNPDIYKISYKSVAAPNNIIFISSHFTSVKVDLVKKALLDLNYVDTNKELLLGIEKSNDKELSPFKEINFSDVEKIKDIYETVNKLTFKENF